jgi:hypothetical protein
MYTYLGSHQIDEADLALGPPRRVQDSPVALLFTPAPEALPLLDDRGGLIAG